ncbi:MAG: spore germination protein, partial [Candidatus Syntrophonatronum acetioxidans]
LKNFSGRTTDKNTRKEETPGNIPLVIEPLPLTSHLSERISALKGVLGNSIDIVVREFWIGDKTNIRAGVIYIDGLVDKNMIFEYILRPLMYEAEIIETKRDLSPGEVFKEIINKRLSTGEVMVKEKDSELFAHLMGGDSIILIDKYLPFIAVCTRAWESRGVEEPANEAVIRGPREGFTETLKVNLALIRRRIKTPYLRFDSLYIGRNTQTNVITAYIDNLANPKLVREAKKRLERIDIDNIISTGQIEELLEDNPLSPFPQLKVTERPDVVAAGLLEGRVAIMTDNTPNALILPATFFELLQGADDYYQRYFFSATLLRMLRLLAVNIALLLPAFYVAITTYHQELLPTALLINIAASREGVPFPALVEALLMEGTFELLREAGLRLPNVVGPAVTIVGALVLGEAAIRAGTVSPAMVIVVALTA